jgi:hypothetical protein
MPQK